MTDCTALLSCHVYYYYVGNSNDGFYDDDFNNDDNNCDTDHFIKMTSDHCLIPLYYISLC